jgi:hypothetical protein
MPFEKPTARSASFHRTSQSGPRNAGLITLAPSTTPLVINKREATSGTGFASLLSGNVNFTETTAVSVADTRVELPVDYRGNLAYRADRWSAAAQIGHGFGGGSSSEEERAAPTL